MKAKFRRLLAGLLIGGMLTCPALAVSSFPDVDENAEYAEAVEYLKGTGIMEGDDKGNFNPNSTVTRGQMAAIVCRMLGEEENLAKDGNLFSDVPSAHWANAYIARAATLGIINGYGDGKFGPDDNVTYEQTVTMIVRAVGFVQEAQEAGGYPDGFLFVASDNNWLEGVMAKKGEFLSRADIATILYNYFMNSAAIM